nr:hypothetical protein [Gammaproteobacteria bacterium]
TKYIFTIPGVILFMSNRLCDPLERFFGQQRQRGGTHANLNVSEFIKNTQALRVINTSCGSIRRNCRGSDKNEDKNKDILDNENTPLAKCRVKN